MTDNREDLNPASDDLPETPMSEENATYEAPATNEPPARYEGPATYEQTVGAAAGTAGAGGAFPTTPPPAPPSWLPPQPTVPAQRSRGRMKLTAGLTALVLVSGGAGGLVAAGLSSNGTAAAAPAAAATLGSTAQTISAGSSTPLSYAAIAAKVLPTVVSIDVISGSSGDTGSGIILTSDGYILTNNHVVTAASSGGTITVHFNDGTTATAKIVGTDLASDLAVIKVAKTGLTPASLGDSSGVKVGDAVLAVGSPLGLTGTVTSGIVSALNRPVDTTSDQSQQQQPTNPYGGGLGGLGGLGGSGQGGGSGSSSGSGDTSTTSSVATVFGAIQTDAAINPGNSGGALVDASGNVIGINSAIASLGSTSSSTQSGNIGVGFAIPINQAKTIAQELITSGKATHAQVGLSVQTNTDPTTGDTTVVVGSVTANGPGATAGLQAGDVITKIDNTLVPDADTLIATVRSHSPGDKVTITYTRSGTTHTATVTLGSSSS
ncbi:MAG: putative serine protease PepD [Frankiales bacterium]|nr:putative serine protease PepD [Frankiales bacterium]